MALMRVRRGTRSTLSLERADRSPVLGWAGDGEEAGGKKTQQPGAEWGHGAGLPHQEVCVCVC